MSEPNQERPIAKHFPQDIFPSSVDSSAKVVKNLRMCKKNRTFV